MNIVKYNKLNQYLDIVITILFLMFYYIVLSLSLFGDILWIYTFSNPVIQLQWQEEYRTEYYIVAIFLIVKLVFVMIQSGISIYEKTLYNFFLVRSICYLRSIYKIKWFANNYSSIMLIIIHKFLSLILIVFSLMEIIIQSVSINKSQIVFGLSISFLCVQFIYTCTQLIKINDKPTISNVSIENNSSIITLEEN
jgi:hypothetical protein